MKYIVDSDWAINCLKGNIAFLQKLTELNPEGVSISVIAVAEIYNGIYGSRSPIQDEQVFRMFLKENGITFLNIEEETALIFARELLRLRGQGTLIGNMDLLIAATALQHKLIVLTNNLRDFRRVEGLEIISIQQNEEN